MSKEKRTEQIHEALQYLDEEMIEDVEHLRGFVEAEKQKDMKKMQNQVSKTTKSWAKYLALVASVCVLIAGSWLYDVYIQPSEAPEEMSKVEIENKTENAEDNLKTENDVIEESLKTENDVVEESLKTENDVVDESLKTENDIEDVSSRTDSAIDDLLEQTPEGALKDSANEESYKENSDNEDFYNAESHREGVYIPKMEVNLKKTDGLECDMIGFIILNGRLYIHYEMQQDYIEKNADFVGEYAGRITGMIDEWTKADGYVDGAGTYIGDVYEVKGVSPEFMLCMVWENGWVETFINHNDITVCKGADLVDEWLDLRGNFDSIAFETIIDQQFAYEPLGLTEEERKVFDLFLDAFADADYVYVEEKMEHPFGGDYDTPDMLEFYYVKENGVRLRFRTLGDGYVSFPWIDACVRIDQEIYDEVVDVLQKYEK